MDFSRKPSAHVGEPRTAVVPSGTEPTPTGDACCVCGGRPAQFYAVSGDSPEVRPHCVLHYFEAAGLPARGVYSRFGGD